MVKLNNSPKNSKNKIQIIDLKHFSIQQLYQKATKAYQQNDSSSEDKWNKMLAQSGTKKDKISAVGLLILQHPQTSLKYFYQMIKWCSDKNHNFAIDACESMANIYINHVFADNSSLNSFVESVQRYIKENKKDTTVTNANLVSFYLESQLKQYYGEFIKSLQALLNEGLKHIKKCIIRILGSLARQKELRRTILSLIINKLGDSDMDVVNQVSKSLKDQFYQDILASQMLMQQTEAFLFRTNLPRKAQFYVINFLNTINFKFLNQKCLNKLFLIFYHFFSKCIEPSANNDEQSSRLFLNSIKGLNRLFSFMKGGTKQTKKIVQQKIQNVYKIVHTTKNVKAKIQLLLFLFQSQTCLHGNISANNRFYRLLYDFINNDQIIHSSLTEMFFDLILICIKADQNLNRVLAICKRMLQLCFTANSNFIITTLIAIDKVIQCNEGFKIFLQQAENVMEDELQKKETYDPHKRDPLFAGADKTCVWQLKCLSNHFHPTVRKFANAITNGEPIQYQGNNPLLQYNLTSFIQKIALQKEKKSEAWKIKVKRNMPKIRSSKYQSLLNKELNDFREDEQYIKKYLQKRNQIHINKKKIQTNNIQQYADQVVQKEIEKLNPKEQDQQLIISQMNGQNESFEISEAEDEFSEENRQNEQEIGEFGREVFEEDMEIDDEQENDEDAEGVQQKQFQDVFDEIEEQNQYPAKNKSKNRRFNTDRKHKNIWKKGKNHKKKFKNSKKR